MPNATIIAQRAAVTEPASGSTWNTCIISLNEGQANSLNISKQKTLDWVLDRYPT